MSDKRPVIFVFGSNLAGRHGKGAALHALEKWGAIPGTGEGLQGQSYAIPTKDKFLRVRPLGEILTSVNTFKKVAEGNPDKDFFVTRVGCGLAGYTDAQIAPFFKDAPLNCHLPEGWRDAPEAQEATQEATPPAPQRILQSKADRAALIAALEDVMVG